MGRAHVTLLGQFEVSVDGLVVGIRSSNERALLARLALEPGSVVRTDSLIEAIWPEGERPNDPARALRYHVWHLRELLEPHRADRSEGTLVLTRPTGYLLALDARAVDAVRLEADWVKARSLAEDPRSRRDTLGVLLDTWLPTAFAEATTYPFCDVVHPVEAVIPAVQGPGARAMLMSSSFARMRSARMTKTGPPRSKAGATRQRPRPATRSGFSRSAPARHSHACAATSSCGATSTATES